MIARIGSKVQGSRVQGFQGSGFKGSEVQDSRVSDDLLKYCMIRLFKPDIMNPVTNSEYQPQFKRLILVLCDQNIYQCYHRTTLNGEPRTPEPFLGFLFDKLRGIQIPSLDPGLGNGDGDICLIRRVDRGLTYQNY